MERPAQSLLPDLQMPSFLTPYSGSLSAGNLLGNLEARLGDFDTQINGLMSAITGRTNASQALSARMQHLQALLTALSANGKDGQEKMKLENLTVGTGEDAMNALDYIRKYGLEEDLNNHGLTPDSKLSVSNVQSALDQLRLVQGQLNGRTEMEMLSLQELTNKRSQAVELTSKLMEAMNQSMRTILGNLGR